MKAAVFHGPRDIRIEEIAEPELADGDVLLKIRASGICGSDLHTYKHGLFEDLGIPAGNGRVMGHEFSGEIVKIKGKSPGVKIGDAVCFVSMGGNAEYMKVPAELVPIIQKIPEGVTFEEAATTEPLATSLHAVNLASPATEETHVVMGAGIIGLGIVQILKSISKVKVIVVDISENRLNMSKQLGADIIVNATKESVKDKIMGITGRSELEFMPAPSGTIDTVYDCAGLAIGYDGEPVLQQALSLTKENGKVVLVAVYEKSADIELNYIVRKGLTVFGSWAWSFDELVASHELISSGKIDRKPLITHRFPLEKAKEAFETQLNPEEAVKVMIMP